jgi:hypothetical protein
MKIAEFFAELGVKGSEKTLGALSGVKKGFGEITSLSLEAKAGMVAAFYAFEKFMSASGQAGTGLTNFTSLTNLSAQSLQQWQYAARQAGVSGEDLTGALKAVQSQMTNMLLGKGAPEGLGLVASTVGFDPNKARDTFYVMKQLQQFAQKVPADVGNQVLKSFGVSEGVISAMRRNVFRPEVFKKTPAYSGTEIAALDRANIAWGNLGQKIAMAFGHFNALHGNQLAKDISLITTQTIHLVEALTRLSERLKVFEYLGKTVEGTANTFKLVGEVLDKIDGKSSKKGDLLFSPTGQAVPGFSDSPVGKFFDSFMKREGFVEASKKFYQELQKPVDYSAHATPRIPLPPSQGAQQNIEINQNLHFQHEGKDHKRTGDSTKKAVQDAFRQLPQGQGG